MFRGTLNPFKLDDGRNSAVHTEREAPWGVKPDTDTRGVGHTAMERNKKKLNNGLRRHPTKLQ